MKVWNFGNKSSYHSVEEENPDSNIPDPSTSGDVPVDNAKSKRKATRNRKGTGKGVVICLGVCGGNETNIEKYIKIILTH